jgi:acyl carrier protein
MEARSRPSRRRIQADIQAFVAGWFREGREDGLEADTPLVTSGIVDSAGVLELVDFLEQKFGIRVPETDVSLENCNTLAGLTDLVVRRL